MEILSTLTAGITHDDPAFPGQHPTYASTSTSLQHSEANAKHQGELASFYTYYTNDNALRSAQPTGSTDCSIP